MTTELSETQRDPYFIAKVNPRYGPQRSSLLPRTLMVAFCWPCWVERGT